MATPNILFTGLLSLYYKKKKKDCGGFADLQHKGWEWLLSTLGKGYSKMFYKRRLRPESNPSPLYIPFWAEKVPLSYTFY